jgi:hypothetical protein
MPVRHQKFPAKGTKIWLYDDCRRYIFAVRSLTSLSLDSQEFRFADYAID